MYEVPYNLIKPKMEYHYFVVRKNKDKLKAEAMNYYIYPINGMIHVIFDELNFAYEDDKIKVMNSLLRLRTKIAKIYKLKQYKDYRNYTRPEDKKDEPVVRKRHPIQCKHRRHHHVYRRLPKTAR